MELKLNVQSVTFNALNVLILWITVPFVLLPEFPDLNHLAHVPATNTLMLTESVNLVDINVLPVKDMLITVLNVLISELQPLLVHVQPDIMKLTTKLNVTLVTQDVINVKPNMTTVLFVLMKESKTHHPVLVKMDSGSPLSITPSNVVPVLDTVKLVKMMTEIVSFVLKTELMPQPVTVQKELSITTKHTTAHLVLTNVKFVPQPQSIVLSVLKDMSTHQSVQSQNHTLPPLKSTTSQSDLPKSSTVLLLVNLVKDIQITVLFVMKTELTHHLAHVSLDITKMITETVLNVTSDV